MNPALQQLAYDENAVKPGWIALGLVALLAVATFLLWRSMNRQLGKIQAPTEDELKDTKAADGPVDNDGPPAQGSAGSQP